MLRMEIWRGQALIIMITTDGHHGRREPCGCLFKEGGTHTVRRGMCLILERLVYIVGFLSLHYKRRCMLPRYLLQLILL